MIHPRLELIKSFSEEYERIEKRGSVWLQAPSGWFHSSNKLIVKWRLESLTDTIHDLIDVHTGELE